MAPSRGTMNCLFLNITAAPMAMSRLPAARRSLSSFTNKLSDPANRVQSYLSRSNDPFLNLSIEDHILRTSSPESTVLFLYTNRPCVVIGRNQNPWTEVNLNILNVGRPGNPSGEQQARTDGLTDTEPPAIGTVELVRRRSGGGTVFHDEGNLNWSITCPRADFTRDKHAEMVVRALRKLGIDRARVNERHDIVLDQGSKQQRMADPKDTHRTAYTVDDPSQPRPLKVSGSAYKLTRSRALHHATTLLASPNLHIIPQYLRSPAKAYIEAKGVESVSSPVGNIGLDMQSFQRHLQEEFTEMYSGAGKLAVMETVGEEHLDVPEVKKGYDELKTKDWIFSQTPQFTLKLNPYPDDKLDMTVHHGIIKAFDFRAAGASMSTVEKVRSLLLEQRLQDISNWQAYLSHHIPGDESTITAIAKSLDKFLPMPELLER